MPTISPSRKTSKPRANYLLKLAVFAVGWSSFSGCAVLSIPSYRTEHCSAPDWVQAENSLSEPIYSESGDAGNCPQINCHVTDCEEVGYVPVFPAIPMPKCIQRWKEHKNLPEGPQGLRFHPLPTRPMFTPRPAAQASSLQFGAGLETGIDKPLGQSVYGTIPRGSQWIESTEPKESLMPGESSSSAKAEIPEVKAPKEAPQTREPLPGKTEPEELPAPIIE